MITTYTFGKKNNNNTSSFSFCGNTKPDYSKILDDLIVADIIDKNSYLFDKKAEDAHIFTSSIKTSPIYSLYTNDKLAKATKFLANYNKYNKKYNIPYTIGKCYYLADNTPVVFYEDEIQIGYDFYNYADFLNPLFIKSLSPKNSKIVIDIYINGAANININI